MNYKIFIFLISVSCYGDFIGTIQDNLSSNGRFNSSNIGDVGDLIGDGTIDGVLGDLIDSQTDNVLSYGVDVLSSSELGSWWSNNNSWATGTMELCYEYKPTTSSSVTPNICSLFKNMNINPCDALPSKLGAYVKKSSSKLEMDFALKDWCNEYVGFVNDIDITDAYKNNMGISGKSKEESKGKSLWKDDTNNNGLKDSIFKSNNPDDGSYEKTAQDLSDKGLGHIVKNNIDKLSKSSKDITIEELNRIEPKVYINSVNEYNDDLQTGLISNVETSRMLFDNYKHINTVNKSFKSLNEQNKSFADKTAVVDSYIEDEDNGVREQYKKWAKGKAEEEIAYTLYDKLGYYYVNFDIDNLVTNYVEHDVDDNMKIAIINNRISKQQYEEKKIILKWVKIGNEKADKLKVMLLKNAIASEKFNKILAREMIYKMIE